MKIIAQKSYEIKLNWQDARFIRDNSKKPIDFFAIFYPFQAIRNLPHLYPEDIWRNDKFLSQPGYTRELQLSNSEPFIYFRDKDPQIKSSVCLATGAAQAQCFSMNEKLYNRVLENFKYYTVQFQVATDHAFDDIIESSEPIRLAQGIASKYDRKKLIFFSPMLVAPQFRNHTIFGPGGEYCVLICYQKLNLAPEQLLAIKDLSTRYVLQNVPSLEQ